MRICLATNGTRGDIYPFLAIGRELASRGHQVLLFTHPYFEGDAARAGLPLRPMHAEIDLEGLLRDPDLFHHRRGQALVFKWVKRSIVQGVRDFRKLLEGFAPDLVVCHHFLIGGKILARERNTPFINVCLAPCAWLSSTDPSPAMQHRPGAWRAAGARTTMQLAVPLVRLLSDRWFAKELRSAGLNPEPGVMFDAFRGGDLNLGLWSHHMRPPCPDDPPGGVIVGFPFYEGDPEPALAPELERFLDAGDPPLVFAMGSAAHHSAGPFYEWAGATCRDLGMRGVLLTGEPDRAPTDLPDSILAVPAAPFSRLFPRAAATIQHGGIGSVSQALRAGRPTLVAARAHDQFNNGVHVQRLGVGRTCRFHTLSERRLRTHVQRVIEDEGISRRAEATGAQLATEEGARIASDYIEAFTR